MLFSAFILSWDLFTCPEIVCMFALKNVTKLEEWDRRLRLLGLRALILKECPRINAGVSYLYRETWLKRILEEL